jgi:hypothetical protein
MLTDLQIEKQLPDPTKRLEVPDGKISGLYLVVQPSGTKSWALRYRVAGSPKKFAIGPYPVVGLAAARKRAQKALAEVVDGVDPSAQKKKARDAQKAANSTADRVENAVDGYVKEYLAKKSKPRGRRRPSGCCVLRSCRSLATSVSATSLTTTSINC